MRDLVCFVLGRGPSTVHNDQGFPLVPIEGHQKRVEVLPRRYSVGKEYNYYYLKSDVLNL